MSDFEGYQKASHPVISEGRKKVTLRVSTGDLAAEIFILNHKLDLVDRGIGQNYEKKFEPGIYKIKIRSGSQIKEELVSLSGEKDIVEVEFEPLKIASPAPIENTAKTHKAHGDKAQEHSTRHRVHAKAGKGSSIYLFARCWTSRDLSKYQKLTGHPARGLTLHNENDELMADIDGRSSKSTTARDPWAACLIEIDPGCYRLRLELADGTQIEQTIATIKGWQTQVFLLQRNYAPDDENVDWRADLAGASILMSKEGKGFNPGDDFLRLDELARIALVNNRNILSDEIRNKLLHGKFDNPLFGVYGAHLLLMGDKPDMKLLNTVVDNLHKTVGEKHPDIEALTLRIKGESAYICSIPPMLRRSWGIIVEKTAGRVGLVPSDSLAAKVSTRVWGAEPFLLWINKYSTDKGNRTTISLYKDALLQHLEQTEQMLSQVREYDIENVLDDMDSVISGFFDKLVSKGNSYLSPEVHQAVIPELVKSLGLPRTTVENLINRITPSDLKKEKSSFRF